MAEQSTHRKIIIVGAGITGLVTARKLQDRDVLVVEAEETVGGRMQTDTIDEARGDTGAQFFVVSDPAAEALVTEWEKAGALRVWGQHFTGEKGHPQFLEYNRYCGDPDMTALCEWLAKDCDVQTDASVTSISRDKDCWQLHMADGSILTAEQVVLTPPVPVSLELLEAGDAPIALELKQSLKQITYQPCITMLATLDGPSGIPEPGALKLNSSSVMWIADNKAKGVSDKESITVQMSYAFTREHDELSDKEVSLEIKATLLPFVKSSVVDSKIIRWKLGRVLSMYDKLYATDQSNTLYFAGDGFSGPCVEGALQSALTTAEAVKSNTARIK